jgi:hypothetical protein
VAEDVDTRDIHRAEGGALRPSECRPRHRVDLLDGVFARFERAQGLDYTEQGDMVRDEVRRVLCDDDALPEALIEKG